jgi:cell division protein FtsW
MSASSPAAVEITRPLPDGWLLGASLLLVMLGLLMVTSASLPLGEDRTGQPFYYLLRQSVALVLGLVAAAALVRTPLWRWLDAGPWLLLLTVLLLALVLMPGVGHEVNGSARWLRLGPVSLQVSELAKLFMIVYVAGYLHRHGVELYTSMMAMLRLMFVLGMVAILLLLEPDFGATAVLVATALGMVFLAGIKIGRFMLLQSLIFVGMLGLVYSSEYRLKRMTSFMDPWQDPFGDGFQLTQALIAIGRGGPFGVGLGESIQKHHYLPEAHTDFLFAILAEELGLIGVLVLIALYAVIVWRGFDAAARAQSQGRRFAASLAYGVSLLLALQVLVNLGVNMGVLPTKGLTLPLISYGGSSMLVTCIMLALLLRVDLETREQPSPRSTRKFPEVPT